MIVTSSNRDEPLVVKLMYTPSCTFFYSLLEPNWLNACFCTAQAFAYIHGCENKEEKKKRCWSGQEQSQGKTDDYMHVPKCLPVRGLICVTACASVLVIVCILEGFFLVPVCI